MLRQSIIVISAVFGGTALSLGACHSASSDWRSANDDNTLSSYRSFVAEHPNDTHVQEAQAMIAYFEDDAAWDEAQHIGSIEGYRHYLELYPQGFNADSARNLVKSIERSAAWATAEKERSVGALQAFLDKYPSGSEADKARAQLNQLSVFQSRRITHASLAPRE